MKEESRVMGMMVSIVKVLIFMTIVTVAMLLLLSFMLLKIGFSDKILLICIGAVYCIVNLIGGFVMGKTKDSKRMLWGMGVGITYFLLLLLVSMISNGGVFRGEMQPLTGFLCCFLGGMSGGMCSNI